MYLDDLDKYFDKVKSRLKYLDFKNLDRDKKKVDLDMKDNLDGVCCNPCNWDGRNWMPTMVGDP